jgi:hypothetical protein
LSSSSIAKFGNFGYRYSHRPLPTSNSPLKNPLPAKSHQEGVPLYVISVALDFESLQNYSETLVVLLGPLRCIRSLFNTSLPTII